MRNTILEFVTGLIQKKGKFPAGSNIAEFDYIDSGHVDSLAITKFVLDIEARFDIEISEDDMLLPQFRTVGGLVELIETRVQAKRQ